jgi:hypothetical protein
MPRATEQAPLRLQLSDGTRVTLALGAVGRDWIAGELADAAAGARSCVVPIAAIAACFPDEAQSRASTSGPGDDGSTAGSLAARLGLAFVLRDLCRRRAPIDVRTPDEQLHGTIDRVSRDHLDLAEHEPGVPRRDAAVRRVRMLPFDRLVLLRF